MSLDEITFSSPHYIFHFAEGSFAHREIDRIVREQESAWTKITGLLQVTPFFKISYYLMDTPEQVGAAYGDNEPMNGFARLPDKVYAVYNQQVQCVGPHEDAHLIAKLVGHPESAFIREGLAMYFDETWWGKPNKAWVADYLGDGSYLPLSKLLSNKEFYSLPDSLTYPIAGAFTQYLIEAFGIEKYLAFYAQAVSDPVFAMNKHFQSLPQLEKGFKKWVP